MKLIDKMDPMLAFLIGTAYGSTAAIAWLILFDMILK